MLLFLKCLDSILIRFKVIEFDVPIPSNQNMTSAVLCIQVYVNLK
jgi:hypothetical protein